MKYWKYEIFWNMRYLEIWTINISATFGNIGHKNSYSVWDLFTQPWWLTPTLGWWRRRRSRDTASRTGADSHGLIVMDNTLLHCTINYSFVQFITVLHYNYAILYCIILYIILYYTILYYILHYFTVVHYKMMYCIV